jgi:dihydroorotase
MAIKNYLLRQGRVIDPQADLDSVCDVLVRDGLIKAVGPDLDPGDAEIIDCRGRLVLPGLIDTHAHVYQYVTGRFGMNADMCGVDSGVTTLIDQGGASCMTLPGFRHFVTETAHTRVVAFLSSYLVGGLEGHYYPSLYSPDCLDVQATVRSANANADLVKGIKAHAELGGFERWGEEVMRLSAAIGKEADLPVYIHFGQLWPSPTEGGMPVDPDSILTRIIDMLKPGDVLAHPFSRHPGGFVETNGKLHPLVREAVGRGVTIDVGHGSHFSYKMARLVLEAGIVPNTLGADMHGYNTTVPRPKGTPDEHPDEDHMFTGRTRFSLVSAMTTMLALGIPLNKVVRMATIDAARMARIDHEVGTLTPGRTADVSVLSDERGRWVLQDNEGTQQIAEQLLQPLFCLKAGVRFDSVAPILPPAVVA